MLSCFLDYVGLSYCNGVYEQSPSGLYINTLPGISVKSIDEIADQEQITFRGVWDDVQKTAIGDFRNKILIEIKKCYKLNKDCDYDELICDNQELVATSLQYLLAYWLMIFRLTSDRLNRYTTVDRKQAEELRDFYFEKFELELENAVLLFDVSSCKLCCGGNPEYVTYLP